jgi:ATP-binding cassette subfamily B protein
LGEEVGKWKSGVDTVLARPFVDGIELSGGQWQRVAVARALAAVERGRKLLIMDEPSANLDVEAEDRLVRDLILSTDSITRVVVTHRLAIARRADEIFVLEGGRLVEHGTHVQLMGSRNTYHRMYTAQAARFLRDDD